MRFYTARDNEFMQVAQSGLKSSYLAFPFSNFILSQCVMTHHKMVNKMSWNYLHRIAIGKQEMHTDSLVHKLLGAEARELCQSDRLVCAAAVCTPWVQDD